MSNLTKLIHVGADLALLAGFLSGVKKNTGLEPNVKLINQPTVEEYAQKYLSFGDYLYDYTVAYASTSSYFKR
ncbi:unnamed protein product [Ambrosiozyma monospora]|uniref:Unnamed protein product n=1 Tax=Ambrosiozyma monospora TaxID=43982 RepID=A0ACB5T0B9_AMBMO|nr:unnamed protein product [Ambrosiozyma monospora]